MEGGGGGGGGASKGIAGKGSGGSAGNGSSGGSGSAALELEEREARAMDEAWANIMGAADAAGAGGGGEEAWARRLEDFFLEADLDGNGEVGCTQKQTSRRFVSVGVLVVYN